MNECIKCGRGYHITHPPFSLFSGADPHTVYREWVCCKSPEYNPTLADKARIAEMEREAARADPRQQELAL